SASARVPPRASSTLSAPGAALGPSGVWITPMTRTSASDVPGADSLVERETVTLPMLLHLAQPRCAATKPHGETIGNNGCYISDLTTVTIEVMSEMSFPLPLLGVNPGRVRLEHLLAGLERPLGGRPPISAEGVALDHLREPVPQLHQVDLVL